MAVEERQKMAPVEKEDNPATHFKNVVLCVSVPSDARQNNPVSSFPSIFDGYQSFPSWISYIANSNPTYFPFPADSISREKCSRSDVQYHSILYHPVTVLAH